MKVSLKYPLALEKRDLTLALSICKSEHKLDVIYEQTLKKIIKELRKGDNVDDLVTILFIFRYLERMGDTLLNIGEALMLSIMGERIKIQQFDSLKQTLSETGSEKIISEIGFRSFWGTRSGCRISRVNTVDSTENFAKEMNIGLIFFSRRFWHFFKAAVRPRNSNFHSLSSITEELL